MDLRLRCWNGNKRSVVGVAQSEACMVTELGGVRSGLQPFEEELAGSLVQDGIEQIGRQFDGDDGSLLLCMTLIVVSRQCGDGFSWGLVDLLHNILPRQMMFESSGGVVDLSVQTPRGSCLQPCLLMASLGSCGIMCCGSAWNTSSWRSLSSSWWRSPSKNSANASALPRMSVLVVAGFVLHVRGHLTQSMGCPERLHKPSVSRDRPHAKLTMLHDF